MRLAQCIEIVAELVAAFERPAAQGRCGEPAFPARQLFEIAAESGFE
ncbi:MAG TPA: hypothetical protein VGX94_00775 [Terriglobia bacterium]|nr:hypothetical protein [Terriglobia bacterium]